MSQDRRNMAVNWQSGMKVRTDHFIALENWVTESLQQTALLRMDSYGILPSWRDQESSLKLHCNVLSNKEIEVVVHACMVVTQGGFRYERRESENAYAGMKWVQGQYKMENPSREDLSVILSLLPTLRVPVGDPDDEIPPRRPYVVPEAKIKIVPVQTPLDPKYELVIAELSYEGEALIVSPTFIPACFQMNSLPTLVQVHNRWADALNTLYTHVLLTYRKLHRMVPSGFDSYFNASFQFVCEQITLFLSHQLSHYQTSLAIAPPREWVEFFMSFARVLYTSFECLEEGMKVKLLETFQKWSSAFIPGPFNDALGQLMNTPFDQEAIYPALVRVEKMMLPLVNLFDCVNKLQYVPRAGR